MSEKKKSASPSETEETKNAKASASSRNERVTKPVKREVRSASASDKKPRGFRNWRAVRFVRDAYRELRYKVTWPTFPEARNMTLIVIVLSVVIGLILGIVDQGLFALFKYVTGK